MLALTPAAVEKVKAALVLDQAGVGLRVGVRGGGCSGLEYVMQVVTAEAVQPSWQRLDIDGLPVYLDPISSMYLQNTTIDYVVEDEFHQGFKFNNPDVKNTCGCGRSFST